MCLKVRILILWLIVYIEGSEGSTLYIIDDFSDTDYDYPQSSQNISRNNHYASSSVVQRHSRAAQLYRQGSYSTFRAGTKVKILPRTVTEGIRL